MSESQPITILFDGVCNLCNGAVNFLIERDVNNQFRYASLQSDFGKKILRDNQLPVTDLQSVIVLENDQVFTKTAAVFKITSRLRRWRWLGFFKIIPASISNAVYSFVARNRYKIFGKRNSCRLPTPAERAKFIE